MTSAELRGVPPSAAVWRIMSRDMRERIGATLLMRSAIGADGTSSARSVASAALTSSRAALRFRSMCSTYAVKAAHARTAKTAPARRIGSNMTREREKGKGKMEKSY